ncbi:sugar phosphate isomerase/epimerase family protein, partial [Paracoccus sp. (in: a-proteobacteria)]|uniref:sugar phosphate isomerase/epimerase family protein n=1 Tax=Paracoccus sp. TaxID=267 RepID=UPI00396C6096
AAQGYGHLVIPLRDHDAIEPERIARFCATEGVAPVTTSPLQIENDISSTDPAIHRRGVERHLAALRLARDMGADRMGGILYSAFGKASSAATAENFGAAAEGLAQVAEVAAASGITLTLEVVNRYESNLVNTAADALRLVETIGKPNVGIHLDTFHMNIEEDDMMSALESVLPRLAYFEVDQNHRGRLGRGSIDFMPLLARLKTSDYRGLIGVEAFSSAISHPDIAAGVAAWRPLFTDGDDVAAEGREIFDRAGF